MNTANYVDQQIQLLKNSGIPLTDAAWKAALLCVGWPYIYGDRGQYCTPSKRQAVYNKYPNQTGLITNCQVLRDNDRKSSCSGCKWLPNGCKVRSYDCRGFTYWILLMIYGWELMGVGATSQWNTKTNWKAQGPIETIPEDKLVCLFVRKDGKMQHTGFGYRGETIECSNGVQHFITRNKKWTHWGLPVCVEGETPIPDPDLKPTLRKGDKGAYVEILQTDLKALDYDLGKYGIDGDFGSATEKAVKKFQKDHGITADGIVGKATWAALDEEVDPAGDLYTVTINGLKKWQAIDLCKEYKNAIMTKEGD